MLAQPTTWEALATKLQLGVQRFHALDVCTNIMHTSSNDGTRGAVDENFKFKAFSDSGHFCLCAELCPHYPSSFAANAAAAVRNLALPAAALSSLFLFSLRSAAEHNRTDTTSLPLLAGRRLTRRRRACRSRACRSRATRSRAMRRSACSRFILPTSFIFIDSVFSTLASTAPHRLSRRPGQPMMVQQGGMVMVPVQQVRAATLKTPRAVSPRLSLPHAALPSRAHRRRS